MLVAGAVEAALAAMKRHLRESKIQENCCVMLWNLAAESPKALETIVKSDGIEAIVASMKRHSGQVRLQKHCFLLLTKIAEQSAELKRQVVVADAVTVVEQNFERRLWDRHSSPAVEGIRLLAILFAKSRKRSRGSFGHLGSIHTAGALSTPVSVQSVGPTMQQLQRKNSADSGNSAPGGKHANRSRSRTKSQKM